MTLSISITIINQTIFAKGAIIKHPVTEVELYANFPVCPYAFGANKALKFLSNKHFKYNVSHSKSLDNTMITGTFCAIQC